METLEVNVMVRGPKNRIRLGMLGIDQLLRASAGVAALLGLMALSLPAVAAVGPAVDLEWDAVEDSRVTHYELHYGTRQGDYQNVVTAAQSKATIVLPASAQTYYLSVRACNAATGTCSAFSNEVSVGAPPVSVDWSPDLSGADADDIGDATPPDDSGAEPGTVVAGELPIEIGGVEVDHEWRRVDFRQQFVDPIVIVKGVSFAGSDPVVVRIRGIDSGGFSIRLQEWDYRDGWHVVEEVSYLVIERGEYELPNGALVEAGSLDTDATGVFQLQRLSAGFIDAPVVLASVTSANGGDAVNARLRDVGTNGFLVAMWEQEGNVQAHVSERIDYVAWQVSSGEIDGFKYEAGHVAGGVDHNGATVTYASQFTQMPVFLADLQSANGGDPNALRWANADLGSVHVTLQEEQSLDSELWHAKETAGYLAADVEQ